MDKKKMSIVAAVSTAMLGLTIVFSQTNLKNFLSATLTTNNLGDYTLVYDSDHRVVNDVIKTSNGNDIWTKANYNASFTNNGIEFSKYGYIQNLSSLNGINSVTINVTSGKYVVSHGYEEPSDLKTPFYYDATINTTQTFTFSNNNPNYFRVQAVEPGTISSISVNYSCLSGEGDPVSEQLVTDGFENSLLRTTYNNGSISYSTDELCQTSFAESGRSLRFSNMTKNENASIVDLASNRDELDLSDDDKYLIMDVKSTNSKVGTWINPFMISGSVTDNSYDIGWQDPTGYIPLLDNPGWYRYYWEIKSSNSTGAKRIPFDLLNGLNIIFTQDIASDEVWYIDNIHFGKLPKDQHTIGANYDFKNSNKFTIEGHEILSFDFKVTNGTKFNFGVGNWDQYFDFSLKPDGRRVDGGGTDGLYTGSYLKSLSNGWYRMYFSSKFMNRIAGAWKTWNFSGNNDVKLILDRGGNDATGFISETRVENDAMSYIMMPSNTYENFANISDINVIDSLSFTYKFIDHEEDRFSFMLSNNWGTYFGYYQLNADGSAYNGNVYPGLTTENLGNGVIKVTFNPWEYEKVTGDPAPGITFFRMHNWGSGVIMVSEPTITPHVHNLVKHDEVKPFRDADGHIEYYECSVCGKKFDKDGNLLTNESQYETKANYGTFSSGVNETFTFASAISNEIVFDYKINSGDHLNVALMSNGWDDFYGYFGLKSDGPSENYAGVTKETIMGDDYIRIRFNIAELAKKSGTPSDVTFLYIRGGWTDANGSYEVQPQYGTSFRGTHKVSDSGQTFNIQQVSKEYGVVDIDVYYNNDSKLSVMLGDGWDIYNGYFDLTKTTKTGDYNGLYVSPLEEYYNKGYIRYRFVLSELTKVNDKPAPTEKFNLVYFNNTAGDAYIDVIPHETHVHTYNLVKGYDAFRTETGIKDHYECNCGKIFDLNHNEITSEDLVVPSRLYSFGPSNRPTISIPLDYQVDYGDEIILDFKVEADEHAEVGFTVGDTASNYFGKFWIESVDYCQTRLQRTDYGITSQRLTDGYLRVTIPIDKTKINSGRQTNPDSIHTINTLDIYASSTSGWPTCTGTVEIMPSKGMIARGSHFTGTETASSDLTINFDNKPIPKATSIVNVDVYFTSDDNTKISMCIGDRTNYNGYYTLYRDPSKMDKIAGLTITQLDDGYVRYSFVLAELTKINNVGATISYDHVYFRGVWTTAEGYVDVSVASTIDSPILEDIY